MRRRRDLAWVFVLAALLLAPGLAHAASLAFTLESHQTPAQLCPAEVRKIAVALRNSGADAWDPELADRVAYHWRAVDGTMIERDGRRTELPGKIKPGTLAEVEAVVVAPAKAGTYVLQWAMVRENVRWYPDPVGTGVQVRIAGTRDALVWAIDDLDELEIPALGEVDVAVRLENRGCTTWSSDAADYVSYRWLAPDGTQIAEGVRTPLPTDVPPGSDISMKMRVVGPRSPGPHVLVVEPVREGAAWFGAPTQGRARVDVEVDDPALAWSLVRGGPPRTIGAGSVIELDLAVRNDGTQTWSAFDGDSVSYRWEREDAQLPIEGVRTALPRTVAPGATVEVKLRVQAPREQGEFRLRIQPVRERVAWFGAPREAPWSGAPPRTTVGPPDFAWSLAESDVPWLASTGRPVTIEVAVRNDGGVRWDPALDDRASYRILDEDGRVVVADGRRTPLVDPVEPGATAVLHLDVDLPPAPGLYTVEVGLLREHVLWFEAVGETAIPVRVRWRSSIWAWFSLTLLLGLLAGERLWLAPRGSNRRFDLLAWPLWTAVAVWLLAELFADFSGFTLWNGASAIAGSMGALTGLVVALVPRRRQAPVALALVALWSVVALADLAYVRFFGSLAPLTALAAVHHLGDARATVGSILEPRQAFLFAPWASGFLLLSRRPVAPASTHWKRRAVLGFAVLAAYGVLRLISAASGDLGTRVFSEAHNAKRYGFTGAHVFQAFRLARELGTSSLGDDERVEVLAALSELHARPPAPHHGAARGADLVLLQVEALQHWAVDAEVEGQPVMPFLSGSRRDALYFTNIFDQTAQGRTSDAEYLVLASGHALPDGALSFLRADNDFRTLVHQLTQAGYSSYSAHPYERGFWNRSVLHPAYGFARSEFADALGPGLNAGWGLADGPFLERVLERSAELPSPAITFAITLSLHHPYESFPASLSELELGALQGTAVGNYLQAMRYFDRSLEAMFDTLRRSGRLEHTLVVLYGDHITGLEYDEDILRLAGVDSWSPDVAARLRRVPAFVWVPGSELAGESDLVGGQIDLGATALHLLGVDMPTSGVGVPLLGEGPGFAAFPDGGAADAQHLLVRRGVADERGRCFRYPEGGPLPREACDDIDGRAAAQLQLARQVLNHDLYADAEAQR